MAPSISSESIEHLKESVNIVDVISRAVDLKRAGANFKGLCPFHNEKTPSFVVSESKQYFTCFGCGARGDVIEFEKRYYNLEFGEAVEKLQNRLIELGYLAEGSADGAYGNMTYTAILKAQKAFGMTEDGIATPAFQEKLFAAAN